MTLKAGIIGMPNVGKSTLFNAITKKNILAANYPFATIDPNVGIVVVPDKRLDKLNEMYNKGILQKGQNLLLVGFGGGLTYGSCIIKWSI